MLEFVTDHVKTKKMFKYAVNKLQFLIKLLTVSKLF